MPLYIPNRKYFAIKQQSVLTVCQEGKTVILPSLAQIPSTSARENTLSVNEVCTWAFCGILELTQKAKAAQEKKKQRNTNVTRNVFTFHCDTLWRPCDGRLVMPVSGPGAVKVCEKCVIETEMGSRCCCYCWRCP